MFDFKCGKGRSYVPDVSFYPKGNLKSLNHVVICNHEIEGKLFPVKHLFETRKKAEEFANA
jgi:hypothetical protein